MLLIDKMSLSQIYGLAIEVAVNIIHPYPFLIDVKYQDYDYKTMLSFNMEVNTIFLTLMYFMRMYHFYKPLLIYSYFMSNRAYRI